MLGRRLGSSFFAGRCLLRTTRASQIAWKGRPQNVATFNLTADPWASWAPGPIDRRGLASEAGDDGGRKVLTSTAEVNIGRLAGAATKTIEIQGDVEFVARGPKAVHNAVKAIALSTQYLQQNTGDDTGSKAIGASIKKVATKTEIDGEERQTIEYRFLAKPVAAPQREKEVNFSVAKDTNTGAMAGELVKALQSRGSVTLGGMGPGATNNAIKAIIIADAYMADHFDKGDALTIIPWQEKVEAQGVGESWRLLMHCEPRLKWYA
mmetsp:Transcript_49616/g.91571  ORF Transcript_49616/g.91571 Transcript_49616/m.91571 type:complete len:265 (-) Transcript_49616:8-802(-)